MRDERRKKERSKQRQTNKHVQAWPSPSISDAHVYNVPRVLHLVPFIFLRKSDCLGCAVLLCFVVWLTLLASFFLLSHLSLKHVHVELIVSLFIRCTLRCEIWAQPAELPWWLGRSVVEYSVCSVECCWFESHPRQLFFLKKSDCLGCAVLLCLAVCLTLLVFLPSFLNVYMQYVQD